MKEVLTNSEQFTLQQPSFLGSDPKGTEDGVGWLRTFARLRLLWARRRLLYRVFAVGLVTTTILAFLIPSSYESRVQLMPPDSNSGGMLALLAGLGGQGGGGSSLGGQSGGLAGIASDLLGIKSTGALFVGVLQSRSVQDRIVDQFDLKRVYHTGFEINAEKKLAKNTEISEDRKSGIITLTVTDHDPKRAAQIAGGYVNQLNAMMAGLNTSSAHRERVFLEERLRDVSKEMEVAEQDFSQFSSKNTTIDVSAQARAMLESSAMLQGQLVASQSELEGLKQIFTENNVRVRSTEARISELREQIQKMAGQSGTQASDGTVASDSPYPSVRQLPILGVGYADRFRRLKVDETVFATLTTEFELAKVQEAKEIPTVKVLDPPNVPEKKAFPPRLIIISFGTIFAVILGAVWIVGVASWNEVDPNDPRKAFASEVFQKLGARYPWMSSGDTSSDGSDISSGNGSAQR